VPFCRQTPLTLKARRAKDYSENPQTLGEHLKKRRRQLCLLQREAAELMGVSTDTVVNWENDKTKPVAAQFRPVVTFLGYDPTPAPETLSERLKAKRRALGITFEQAAKFLGWDPATLTRYLNGTWRMPPSRSAILEVFLSARPEDLADGLKAIPDELGDRLRTD
jgi:transcriptional regulator with XRE-family HTH domain